MADIQAPKSALARKVAKMVESKIEDDHVTFNALSNLAPVPGVEIRGQIRRHKLEIYRQYLEVRLLLSEGLHHMSFSSLKWEHRHFSLLAHTRTRIHYIYI